MAVEVDLDGQSAKVRTAVLLGAEKMARLKAMHVLVVGVGGVGSWCAEALARSGVGKITLIDCDKVEPSNLNRQCEATIENIGCRKVEAMRDRILAIAPGCGVTSVELRVTRFEDIESERYHYDFIVDAIDEVSAKAELILGATAAGIPIVSSLGAARRVDPTKVEVRRFDKVEGDALARALRQRFKRMARYPSAKFDCVMSSERPAEIGELGSIMPVTAAFGMALAAYVIRACNRLVFARDEQNEPVAKK